MDAFIAGTLSGVRKGNTTWDAATSIICPSNCEYTCAAFFYLFGSIVSI
jgi:hypothetical protein